MRDAAGWRSSREPHGADGRPTPSRPQHLCRRPAFGFSNPLRGLCSENRTRRVQSTGKLALYQRVRASGLVA